MDKESRPGFWAGLLTRTVRVIEDVVTPSSSASHQPAERISRREFLKLLAKKVKKNSWIIPVAILGTIGGPIVYLVIWNEKKGQFELTPEMKNKLKTISTGERLLFWPSGKTFSVYNVNFANNTRDLHLALNEQVFEDFLKENKVNLKRVGRIDFFMMSGPSPSSTSWGYRQAVLHVPENAVSKNGFLDEASRDLSSSIVAFLLLGKDNQFWRAANAPQLFGEEKLRLLANLPKGKTPPLSLWREMPD